MACSCALYRSACSVVVTRREHKVVFYSLTDPRMRALLEAVEDILIVGRPHRPGPAPLPRARMRALGQAAQFGRIADEP